jgi:hypothetical protein
LQKKYINGILAMSGIFKASVLRKWIIPGFLFLGAFILISYGCGGGGGGGSSIVLPPHATTGIIPERFSAMVQLS